MNTTKNKGHVYVLDDDLEIRESLSRSLGFMGYDVHSYPNPKDFINLDEIYSPAVILLDMKMKGVSGIEFQEQLINKGVRIPIIFISGQSEKHEIIQAMKNGAFDFLLKPFDLIELDKTLSKAITHSRQIIKKIDSENINSQRYNLLTSREKEVCLLLAEGLKIKDISLKLGAKEATIKIHKARVMKKMNAQSAVELFKMIGDILSV